MAGKSSDWDNADFLLDLVVGLYTGAQTNKGLTPAIKDSIEEYLKSRGYSTSFDAVRQHVQKLRKNRDTSAIQNSGAEPTTPRKPRGAGASGTKTPAKRTPKRKAPKSADIADDEDDLEDMKLQLKMETADEDILSPKSLKRAKIEHDDEDELNSGEA